MGVKIVLKDLKLFDRDGALSLNEIGEMADRKKISVLESAVKEHKPREVLLINPFSDLVSPTEVEEILGMLSSVEKVVVYPKMDVYDSMIFPENVEVTEDEEIPWDFSSSPVNNVPKVFVEGEGESEIGISPLWVLEIGPDDEIPVSTVEGFVKEMSGGTLVVILYTYLLDAEREAIFSFVEGTGGFVVDLSKKLLEPKDEVEVEFMKRMRSRVGKYMGMRALRGEEL